MDSGSSPYVVVARIVKPHGIRGEVVLESFTDVEGRIDSTDRFQLLNDGIPVRELDVESCRFFRNRYVIKFQGVSTRTDAEFLRNLELAVPEQYIGTLRPDQFFIHELVGCTVRLKNGQELGSIRNVLKNV